MTIQPNNGPRLRVQLLSAVFARLVINTAHRMTYSFLPVFSRGLGISAESLTALLSARSALGMSAPVFGPIPDRLGRRTAMLIGLAVFCAGLILVAVFPGPLTFFAATLLIVICKFVFDPALQAHLSDRTPYSQRGLVIAVSEFGWSGAVLVGMPALGFLIAHGDWRSPFLPTAAMGFLAGLGIWLAIPGQPPPPARAGGGGPNRWIVVWRNPAVIATLSIGLIVSMANDIFSVVYARWLEGSFGLSVEQLGLTAIVIGVAELIGEGLVALLADRLGKRRAVAAGLAFSALAYLALCLPMMASNLQLALGAIFFAFVTFEFAVVASIPLVTELVPEARATVMSANMAFHAAGRTLGALLGGWLFHFGFAWNGAAAALLNLLWIPVILWIVKERAQR